MGAGKRRVNGSTKDVDDNASELILFAGRFLRQRKNPMPITKMAPHTPPIIGPIRDLLGPLLALGASLK
jgi:hypothetical protein